MKLNVNYDVKRISTERYTTVLKRLRDRKERKLNFKLLFYFELGQLFYFEGGPSLSNFTKVSE